MVVEEEVEEVTKRTNITTLQLKSHKKAGSGTKTKTFLIRVLSYGNSRNLSGNATKILSKIFTLLLLD